MDTTIDPHTQAKSVGLKENSGIATLSSGSTEVHVTAKFIGTHNSVHVASLSNTTDVQAEAMYYAPTNTFTVTCTDGKPATEDRLHMVINSP